MPALYGAVMTQARRAEFFGASGVPDTFENRFEHLVLHMFLVIDRLNAEGREGQETARALTEFMVSDLDRTCREMGVGDVGVAKRMKNFMSGFYGRLKAYTEALASKDEKDILRALDKNLFASISTDHGKLGAMRAYIQQQKAHLAGLNTKDLQNGNISFSNEENESHA